MSRLRLLWNRFRLFGFGPCYRMNHVVYYIDGVLYWWIGGYGAQLESYEWGTPKETKRTINKREYKIFSSQPAWLMHRNSWATALPAQPHLANKEIRKIKTELNSMI